MASAASQARVQRAPVFQGKTRVTGLWARTNADGSITYEVQKRVDGKPKRIVLRDVQTKSEAVLEAQRLTVGIADETVKIGDRSITVRALVDDFLARERGVLGTRAAKTTDLYEHRLRKHVLPTIGSMKAGEVKVQHVRRLVDAWRTQGQAGASIRKTVAALAAVFKHGVLHLGVGRNPVRDLERGELPSGQRQTEPRYLAQDEVERLLAEAGSTSRPVASALFYGALRVSEALSLTWSMIDFDAETIAVPGTKTDASAATIRLLPPLAAVLREHRAKQAARGFDRVKPDALVFQTREGTAIDARNMHRAVTTASRRAGLVPEGAQPVGPHDLRHSLAGCAFALGLSPVEVSKMLRHANPQVTLTVYAGLAESAALAAGDKLAAGLGASS